MVLGLTARRTLQTMAGCEKACVDTVKLHVAMQLSLFPWCGRLIAHLARGLLVPPVRGYHAGLFFRPGTGQAPPVKPAWC